MQNTTHIQKRVRNISIPKEQTGWVLVFTSVIPVPTWEAEMVGVGFQFQAHWGR
jgi:hypothetical protein